MWEDEGSKFYNRSMNSWLLDNGKEFYTTHYEQKSVDVERFIRTLMKKINKYMTSISNIYFGKLDDIANEYNSIYHITIKSIDFKTSTYIDFEIENNNKVPKFVWSWTSC